jgi:carbamoyl-phosphate synthase large subunit
MKSTGEVMGSDPDPDVAYLKARMATEVPVASGGGAYVTVRSADKENVIPIVKELLELGFKVHCTPGTADVMRRHGLGVQTAYRITDRQQPDALNLMRKNEIQFIINIPTTSGGAVRDGNMMRRLAVELNIPFVTTLSGAKAEVSAIRAQRRGPLIPQRLKVSYLKD